MKKIFSGVLFFIGWLLSPLTWWNDAFVNIPLSYLAAYIIFYLTRFSFAALVIGSYLFTNIAGFIFMYIGGKKAISASGNKAKTVLISILTIVIYSALILWGLSWTGKIGLKAKA